jgi:G3E family GTPase
MPIPVVIITGFLGCGKTTLLRRLLPFCGTLGRRPALIINEVGDTDVDGALLADLHAEQVRLVGGCVCCTLQAQLAETIYTVVEQDAYDLILLECSGLSNPVDIVSILSAPALLPAVGVSHIVAVVDAVRAGVMLQAVELAKVQMATADVLVLNKTDRVDAAGLAAAEALVRAVAPAAEIMPATYGHLDDDACTRLLTDPVPVHRACACDHGAHHHHDHDHAPALPASFCTVALPLPAVLSRARAEALLRALPANVLRAKGFCHLEGEGWHALHRVYDAVDLIPYPQTPAAGPLLICIGQHLDAVGLRAMAEIEA